MARDGSGGAAGQVHVFVGKGGVGKTTCAAAAGLRYGAAGAATLAISTDPTPSLSHIFELERRGGRREVAGNLSIMELGLDAVRRMWDERFGREVYAVFSAFVDVEYDAFVEFMTSILPGLNEEFMVDFIRRLRHEEELDHIVWDTAPLGQTLALLEMPALLSEHLKMAPRVYSRLRTTGERRESVMQVLERWDELAQTCIDFLREDVRFSMVTIPEALAVLQLEEVLAEMERYGLSVRRLIINNVITDPDSGFLKAKAEQQGPQLERLRSVYGELDIREIPLFPYEIRGIDRLRQVAEILLP